MRIQTMIWLAISGGRSDVMRIALTALGAALGALALLAAATVLCIRGQAEYTNLLLAQQGLRPGVVATLLLLCVPVLFFVGQCARVGGPARDRRLAAIRMSGGTPRQVARLAATETGVAAALGAAVGGGLYFLGRVLLDHPEPGGVRALPTDVLPPWWVTVTLLVGLPLVGVGFAVVAMRRVLTTPFGVVRRRKVTPPRVLPALLLFVGVGGLVFLVPAIDRASDHAPGIGVILLITLTLAVMSCAGLVLGAAALSSVLGRLIAGRTGRPALLIAARRLIADPWAASRSLGALLVTLFFGGAVLGVRSYVIGSVNLQAELNRRMGEAMRDPDHASPPNPFYERAFDLIDLAIWAAALIAAAGLLVATAEQLVARRRTLAVLTAAGTPRAVMVRAALLELALPLTVGVAMSVAAGALAIKGFMVGDLKVSSSGETYCNAPAGVSDTWCDIPGNQVELPPMELTRSVSTPWLDLLVLGGGAALVTMAVGCNGAALPPPVHLDHGAAGRRVEQPTADARSAGRPPRTLGPGQGCRTSLPGTVARPPTPMQTSTSAGPSAALIWRTTPAGRITASPAETSEVLPSTVTASAPETGIQICSRSIPCTGPSEPAGSRTRQLLSSWLPWLGPASAAIVPAGVVVVRAAVSVITYMGSS